MFRFGLREFTGRRRQAAALLPVFFIFIQRDKAPGQIFCSSLCMSSPRQVLNLLYLISMLQVMVGVTVSISCMASSCWIYGQEAMLGPETRMNLRGPCGGGEIGARALYESQIARKKATMCLKGIVAFQNTEITFIT